MKIITEPEQIKIEKSIVTLGKFDGNHIGHQLLFQTAIARKQGDEKVVVFTFRVPPASVLRETEKDSLRSILTYEERIGQEWPEGIDYVIEFPFNEEIRRMSPEDFVRDILVGRLDVRGVVVGEDFHFGKDRAGNIETLRELGKLYDYSVIPVEKVKYRLKGEEVPREVSSTLIKEEIRKGNLEDVRAMLGRPFSMTGEVREGKRLGRRIGFPTINFSVPEDKILPPNGVYAARTVIEGKEWNSITNIGIRPTFDDGEDRTVETHIFGFRGDLYGKKLRVDLYHFIRPEKKFGSAEELKKEIADNKLAVEAYFAGLKEK